MGDSASVDDVTSAELPFTPPRRRFTDLCLMYSQTPASAYSSRDTLEVTSHTNTQPVAVRPSALLSKAKSLREVLKRAGKLKEPEARDYSAKLVLVVQRLHEEGIHDLNLSIDTVYIDDGNQVKVHLPRAFTSPVFKANSLTHVTSLQKMTSLVGGSAGELTDWRRRDDSGCATDDVKSNGTGKTNINKPTKSESDFSTVTSLTTKDGACVSQMTKKHCSDWSNLGVLLFWMITGNMPFFDETASYPPEIPINTLRLQEASTEVVQLVMTLLCWRYESWQLMGATDFKTFAKVVRGHAFFNEVNWEEVERSMHEKSLLNVKVESEKVQSTGSTQSTQISSS